MTGSDAFQSFALARPFREDSEGMDLELVSWF